MDGSYLSTISKLNHFGSYFNTEIYYLDRMTEKRIVSIFNYYNFASMTVQVDLIGKLEKLIKSPYFRKMRSDLRLRLDRTKRVMNPVVV
jgi:hypothetical protein